MPNELKPCPMRHENGNCLPTGGFCTDIDVPICKALLNAYTMGYADFANWAKKINNIIKENDNA